MQWKRCLPQRCSIKILQAPSISAYTGKVALRGYSLSYTDHPGSALAQEKEQIVIELHLFRFVCAQVRIIMSAYPESGFSVLGVS